MKTLLSLCAGLFLAAVVSQAQSPPGNAPETLLSVYVAAAGDNVLPRIALGIEKPTLNVATFEKVARIPVFNGQSPGIAAQLKPDDAKVLAAAISALADRNHTDFVPVALWFFSPDNEVLACITYSNNTEGGVVKSGVLSFYDTECVKYLAEKLHPK